MKTLRLISRIVVGITFIFSGFVKGVDPLGTMYKIEDYFIAYGMDWALDLALPLAFLLVLVEFLLGAFILLNIRVKLTSYLLLAMMSFFTVVTFYDALYNPVPDCGCFGEAIKLTNWETFYKNIVLMVFTLIIVFTSPSKQALKNTVGKNISGVVIAILFLGFSWYSYRHLPPVDFRDWKVGKDMKQTGEPEYYLVYENKESGEQKRYLSAELPWSDSTWMSNWEFVRQEIDNSNVVKPHNLQIMSVDGDDMTKQLIETDHYQFLVASYSLNSASENGFEKIIKAYKTISDGDIEFAVITASLEEEIILFREKFDTDIPVYQADDIELKAMVRANPGVVLLHEGVVIDKWHHHDFPGAKEIKNILHSD